MLCFGRGRCYDLDGPMERPSFWRTPRRQVFATAEAREFFSKKLAFTTGPVELNRELKRGADIVVVDVRAEEDYRKGHIPGAVNLPQESWNTLEGLEKGKLHVLYCYTQQCHLAASAALEFAAKGYSVMEMDGGFEAWEENALNVDTGHQDSRARQPVSV